jgi:5-(carboxyamino)imidazole ribonucleotide synthase
MPPTVGVIGGGQLARMMIPAAVNLGIDLRVLAENDGESAALAVRQLGDYRNVDDVLRFAQGVDVVTFDREQELDAFLADNGGVGVLKTPTGGYDGKGVRVVRAASEAADWFGNGDLLVEELVSFRRELAQLVARRPSGDIAAWSLVESMQKDGVCAEVIAPAPNSSGKVADVALEVASPSRSRARSRNRST